MPSHLAAFLSYAHLDDGHGKITGFRNALTVAVSQAFGEDFEIFQDRDSINWGQHWPKKIEQGLAGGRFLIAILSPSFFRSDNCRQEVARFLEIERAAGREDLILPVYFRTTPYLEDSAKRNGNPLAKSLALRQHRDWRELRNLPFTDEKVLNELDSLAEELVQALDRPAYVNGEDPSSKEPHISESRPSTPSYPGPGVEEASASSEFLARDPGRMWPNLKTLSPEFIDPGNERRASSKKRNLVEYEPGSVIQDIEESWCPKLVVIPPGDSIMGSPSDEEGHRESEEPRHLIHIERPFALGIYPVTFDEFDHFCLRTGRAKPGDQGWGRGRRPVINVNVLDAEAYLAWLSEETGATYHLPSEAMWEHACRAETITPYYTGMTISTDQANFHGSEAGNSSEEVNYRGRTIEVGSLPGNDFGLYDMHGNVWEWCADPWHKTYTGAPTDGSVWLDGGDTALHVVRGGSWHALASRVRSACRGRMPSERRHDIFGFRCARDLA